MHCFRFDGKSHVSCADVSVSGPSLELKAKYINAFEFSMAAVSNAHISYIPDLLALVMDV